MSEIRDEMEAALAAADDSSPSTPESTPDVSAPTETAPAAEPVAASQPSDTGAAPETDSEGPIPYSRHKAVLTNLRNEYAWLKDHGDTQTVQQKLAILRRAEQDPAGFLRDFAQAARLNPQELFQPAAPPKVEAPPEPDILLENGQMTYSNERLQQLLAFQQRQLEQRFNQELAPIKQERAVTQIQQQAHQHARQEIEAAQTWPGFAEHKADIAAFLRANGTATLRDAYINVVPSKLAEQAKAAETQGYQKALTEFQQKAGAASTPSPRMSVAATSSSGPMTIREALEQALQG